VPSQRLVALAKRYRYGWQDQYGGMVMPLADVCRKLRAWHGVIIEPRELYDLLGENP
jgi:hypothetical protein